MRLNSLIFAEYRIFGNSILLFTLFSCPVWLLLMRHEDIYVYNKLGGPLPHWSIDKRIAFMIPIADINSELTNWKMNLKLKGSQMLIKNDWENGNEKEILLGRIQFGFMILNFVLCFHAIFQHSTNSYKIALTRLLHSPLILTHSHSFLPSPFVFCLTLLLLTSCKRTLCSCTMYVHIAYYEITVAGESNIFLTLLQLKKTLHNRTHKCSFN